VTDVFARALVDFHRDDRQGQLRYRDGDETVEHDVSGYFEPWDARGADSFLETVDGRVLDLGAGAGRQALAVQEGADVVPIEPSDALVAVMRDRGLANATQGDMFSLREGFDRDAFDAAYSVGTQVGLAKSVAGLRAFLDDLAHVTTPDATALFDGYDPGHERTRDLIGFRDDPARGGAYRIVQYEYDDVLGKPWLFRLFTREELREATTGTDWTIREIRSSDGDWRHAYNVHLAKR
jgi:SAM-dependent methyltransferase